MTTNTARTTPSLQTEVRHTDNLRDPSRPWALRWQTRTMAAPAFWYFATEARARHEERCLHTQHRGNRPAEEGR